MSLLLKRLLLTKPGIDTLPIRLGIGVIFIAHGAQKLFGWFGGYGLEGTGGWMESIGLSPGVVMAGLAGGIELIGGLLLIIGLLVRPAAFALAITMLVAIFTVHLNNGLFMNNNGYEFGLALLLINLALIFRGAGSHSIDNIIAKTLSTNPNIPNRQLDLVDK